MKRVSLQVKFMAVIFLLLLAIFAAITYEIVRINSQNLRNGLERESKSFAELAVKPVGDTFLTYKDSGQLIIQQQIQKFTDLDPNVSNIAIADTTGKVLYSQISGLSSIDSATAATFDPIYHHAANHYIDRIYVPFIEDSGLHQYVVIYQISAADVQSSLRQIEDSTLLLGLLALLISVVASYGLMNWLFVAPIDQMSHQAMAISSGNLDQQIKLVRHDEIGDLATAVNAMANSLKADIQKLREVDALKSEFMMISSHNLRTPLSLIAGYLEALDNLKLNKEAAKLVEIVDANTQRLKVFAENMLVISQLETGRSDIEPVKPVDTSKYLATILEQLKTLADTKQIKVVTSLPPKLPQLNLQSQRFHDALWNLLDNALKFTSSGGTIRFGVELTGQQFKILVSDTGVGIAPEEIPKLFTKFHRGTSTLTYDYEGTGIGLYLTKLIIEEQGGSISLRSVLGQGTEVTVTLPLAQNNHLTKVIA